MAARVAAEIVVGIYKLFDTNSKALRFERLLELAEAADGIDAAQRTVFGKRISELKKSGGSKVMTLRSEHYAHLNQDRDEDDVLSQVGLTMGAWRPDRGREGSAPRRGPSVQSGDRPLRSRPDQGDREDAQ
jgi:hypothetical protein